MILTQLDAIRQAIDSARVVAVLGAHTAPERPAYYVPAYLAARGVRILPVNPRLVGQELFGEPIVATLAELAQPIDLVDVFRGAHALPGHLDDLLAMSPRPTTVWFQLGIRNETVAQALSQVGIQVVQDQCAKVLRSA